MSNAVMGLRLKQQLTLTPRLQQSVKLLQLSAIECVQELHQAIAQNPFLEEPVEVAESSQAEDGSRESTEGSDRELDFTSSGGGSGGGEDTPDWTEWNVYLSRPVGPVVFAVGYQDSDLDKSECFGGSNICDGRAVLSISAGF